MNFNIKKAYKLEGQPSIIILAEKPANLPVDLLTPQEIDYSTILYDIQKKNYFEFNRLDRWIFVQLLNLAENTPFKRAENLRKAGDKFAASLNEQKCETVTIIDCLTESKAGFTFGETINDRYCFTFLFIERCGKFISCFTEIFGSF